MKQKNWPPKDTTIPEEQLEKFAKSSDELKNFKENNSDIFDGDEKIKAIDNRFTDNLEDSLLEEKEFKENFENIYSSKNTEKYTEVEEKITNKEKITGNIKVDGLGNLKTKKTSFGSAAEKMAEKQKSGILRENTQSHKKEDAGDKINSNLYLNSKINDLEAAAKNALDNGNKDLYQQFSKQRLDLIQENPELEKDFQEKIENPESPENQGLSQEKAEKLSLQESQKENQEKISLIKKEYHEINDKIKEIENTGLFGKIKNVFGDKKIDFNGQKYTKEELKEKLLDFKKKRFELISNRLNIGTETKDLERKFKIAESFEKNQNKYETEKKRRNAILEHLSKNSKFYSRTARGLSITWAATGGAGLATWFLRFGAGMVVGKGAALAVDSHFNKKKEKIKGETDDLKSSWKLEQKADDFDIKEILKLKSDEVKKLSDTEKKQFWTKLVVSGALGAGAAYETGMVASNIDAIQDLNQSVSNQISGLGEKIGIVENNETSITKNGEIDVNIGHLDLSQADPTQTSIKNNVLEVGKEYKLNDGIIEEIKKENSNFFDKIQEQKSVNYNSEKIYQNHYTIKEGDSWSEILHKNFDFKSKQDFWNLIEKINSNPELAEKIGLDIDDSGIVSDKGLDIGKELNLSEIKDFAKSQNINIDLENKTIEQNNFQLNTSTNEVVDYGKEGKIITDNPRPINLFSAHEDKLKSVGVNFIDSPTIDNLSIKSNHIVLNSDMDNTDLDNILKNKVHQLQESTSKTLNQFGFDNSSSDKMRSISEELSNIKNSEVILGDDKSIEEITKELLSKIKTGVLRVSDNLEFTQNPDGNITITQNGITETIKKPGFITSLFGGKGIEEQLGIKIDQLNIKANDISRIG